MRLELFVGMAQNAAFLIAAAVVYDLLLAKEEERPHWTVVSGVFLGGLTVLVMATSVELRPGVVFDTRSVLLSVAGLFSGAVPTLVAMAIAAAYRLALGGTGAAMGVAVILLSGGLGLAYRYGLRQRLERVTVGGLILFGLVVHVGMLACSVLLPPGIRGRVLENIALPVLVVYPPATAATGWVFLHFVRRQRLAAETARRELLLERLRLLRELERRILEGGDTDHLIEAALESLGRLLAPDRASVAVVQEDGERATVYARGLLAGELGSGAAVAVDEAFADPDALRRGRAYWVADASDLAAPGPVVERLRAAGLRSFANVPGHARGRVACVVNLGYTRPAALDEEGLEVAREVADALAVGLEQERLRRELERRLEDLQHVAAESRLREEQLRTIYDTVGDVVFMLEVEEPEGGGPRQYRFRSVNRAFLEATGLERDQVEGRLVEEVIPPVSHELVRSSYETAIRQRRAVRWEETSPYPAGLKVGEVAVAPVFEGERCRYLVGSVHDITEHRRLQADLREAADRLEARVAERTRELEAFVHAVSHDLRAPLRAMEGFARILEEDFGARLPEAARGHVARIRAAAVRAMRLADALLDLSRASRAPLRRERVDLSAMAGEVLAELTAREPDRRFELRVAPGLEAEGDPDLLRLLLTNLLANAVKFTAGRDPAVIEVGAEREGGERVFFVRDNGAGFEPEAAEAVFEAFRRLHPRDRFPGTGVGLATVRRIVERHGGRVWAEGTPGRGAVFRFTLGTQETGTHDR